MPRGCDQFLAAPQVAASADIEEIDRIEGGTEIHPEQSTDHRQVEAEDAGDPIAGLADFAQMATRTEAARLAGEGKEPLVSAVGALEPGESGGQVAAAMELADDVDGVETEKTVDGAVALLEAGDKIGPTMVDDLPKQRGAGTARAVDGGHDNLSWEPLSCLAFR